MFTRLKVYSSVSAAQRAFQADIPFYTTSYSECRAYYQKMRIEIEGETVLYRTVWGVRCVEELAGLAPSTIEYYGHFDPEVVICIAALERSPT